MKNYIYIFIVSSHNENMRKAKYDLIKWTMLTKNEFSIGYEEVSKQSDCRRRLVEEILLIQFCEMKTRKY